MLSHVLHCSINYPLLLKTKNNNANFSVPTHETCLKSGQKLFVRIPTKFKHFNILTKKLPLKSCKVIISLKQYSLICTYGNIYYMQANGFRHRRVHLNFIHRDLRIKKVCHIDISTYTRNITQTTPLLILLLLQYFQFLHNEPLFGEIYSYNSFKTSFRGDNKSRFMNTPAVNVANTSVKAHTTLPTTKSVSPGL